MCALPAARIVRSVRSLTNQILVESRYADIE